MHLDASFQSSINESIKILFLASHPNEASQSRMGEELREISNSLEAFGERMSLEAQKITNISDLTRVLSCANSHVIHFSGHGVAQESLCYRDNLNKIKIVSSEGLTRLFESVSRKVVCVVLNGCHSVSQVEIISRYVPFVIGVNQTMGKESAILFLLAFYKELVRRSTIQQAYEFGWTELLSRGVPKHLLPTMKEQSNDYIE